MADKPGFLKLLVRHRWRAIIFHKNSGISVTAVVIYVILASVHSSWAPEKRTTIGEVADSILAISGFGFSIAIAAVALVLALPQSRLLRTMMLNPPGLSHQVRTRETPQGVKAWREGNVTDKSLRREETTPSAFSDLIFVFTWTALAQVFAALAAFIAKLFAAPSVVLTRDDPAGMVAGALLVGTMIYALGQLVVALVTVVMIANLQESYFKGGVEFIEGNPDDSIGLLERGKSDKAVGPGEGSRSRKQGGYWWKRGPAR